MSNSEQKIELIISNSEKVKEQISQLYLKQTFSDIVIKVSDEQIPAHKLILAARVPYFASLLYDDTQNLKSEIVIDETSLETVKMMLEYIYTGNVELQFLTKDPKLEILILANKFAFTELKQALITKLKESVINENTVCPLLKFADNYNLDDLKNVCLEFLDKHPSQLLSSDCFNNLSEATVIKLLQRDSFLASELELFKAVAEWFKVNTTVDKKSILKHVRLSCLSVADIVTVVWPSKLFDNEELLNALSGIISKKTSKVICRQKNLATPENGAEVVAGTNTSYLLTGNRDVFRYAQHTIGEEGGIIIKFKSPLLINHIHTRLFDNDDRCYSYYVEISTDQKNWKKVVDYSNYHCRSYQNLYFDREFAQYIRFTGTSNTANNYFHLIFVEVFYASTVPKLINDVIEPTRNVALPDKGAVVIKGEYPDDLLNGDTGKSTDYTSHVIGSESIILQLNQPYIISTMKFKLYDRDTRDYKYYISVSKDNSEWETVVDKTDVLCRSWQNVKFPKKAVVYIKITGTYNSANNNFHVVHFESPDEDAMLQYQ